MNRLSHRQAIQWIHRRLDGLLNDSQLLLLDEHLQSCETCGSYAAEIASLPMRLQNGFRARWDPQSGPSQNLMEQVTGKARTISMANRISSGARLLAGAMALIVVGIAINFVVSQLQGTSSATNATETVNTSAFATDGLLAFTSDQNGNSEIYTMHADGSRQLNLTSNPAYDGTPFWSPDGRWITFTSDREGSTHVFIMGADGSNVIQLTDGEGSYAFDANGYSPWSPDGSKLIVSHAPAGERTYQFHTLDITDKTINLLTDEAGPYTWASWSPDGKHIAFTSDAGGIPRDLFIVGSDGTGLVKLTENLSAGEYFMFDYDWSQDGASIFFATHRNQQVYQDATYISTVYKANMDGSMEVAATATAGQIIDWWNDMDVRLELGEMRLSWTRSDGSQSTLKLCENRGQMVGIAHRRSNAGNWLFGSKCSLDGWLLYWADSDGATVHPLLESTVAIDDDVLFNVTWSSDDQHIAFVSLNSLSTDVSETLYVLDVAKAREDPSVQPFRIMNGSSPSWQPIQPREASQENPTPEPTQTASSDRLIAFTAAIENGILDIYSMRPDGSELTNLTDNPAHETNPYWSPDGKRIAFESDLYGFTHIFVMNADGSGVFQVTHGEAQHQFPNSYPWSPDGSRLLYTEWTPEEEIWTLYAISADGQQKTSLSQVPNIYTSSSWSPDGELIAFVSNDPQNPEALQMMIVDPDGENLTDLTSLLGKYERLGGFQYDWSPDGRSIFFTAYRHTNEGGDQWIAYEADLDNNRLIEKAASSTPMSSWWEGTAFITGFDLSTLTWMRQDGTYRTLNALEQCDVAANTQIGFLAKRSFIGDLLISVSCPNDDLWLYWAAADGSSIKQLLDAPLSEAGFELSGLVWSPDNEFIALNISSPNMTDMYILNVSEALSDPSIQPLRITLGGGSMFYGAPSWQPAP